MVKKIQAFWDPKMQVAIQNDLILLSKTNSDSLACMILLRDFFSSVEASIFNPLWSGSFLQSPSQVKKKQQKHEIYTNLMS